MRDTLSYRIELLCKSYARQSRKLIPIKIQNAFISMYHEDDQDRINDAAWIFQSHHKQSVILFCFLSLSFQLKN